MQVIPQPSANRQQLVDDLRIAEKRQQAADDLGAGIIFGIPWGHQIFLIGRGVPPLASPHKGLTPSVHPPPKPEPSDLMAEVVPFSFRRFLQNRSPDVFAKEKAGDRPQLPFRESSRSSASPSLINNANA